jgi:hypothetical protein
MVARVRPDQKWVRRSARLVCIHDSQYGLGSLGRHGLEAWNAASARSRSPRHGGSAPPSHSTLRVAAGSARTRSFRLRPWSWSAAS